MDVEKTIEFILEQQAQIAAMQMKAEEHAARHDRETARHDREIDHINSILRRAIRLGVQEVRNERKRRQELDARFELKMDQIASAHLLTEEALKRADERIDRVSLNLDRLGEKVDKLSDKLDKLGDKVDNLSDKVDKFVDASLRPGNGHPQ
jgi:predicted nuclease with TOPRIM domain